MIGEFLNKINYPANDVGLVSELLLLNKLKKLNTVVIGLTLKVIHNYLSLIY